MIAVAEAKKIIAAHLLEVPAVEINIGDALQRRLAADVYSPVDVPAYIQSSMDGYAFAYADWQKSQGLPVNGLLQAGAKHPVRLQPGKACRIFTGAPLPDGADTVVMQENTTISGNTLFITDETIRQGNSVRLQGSAIQKGGLALPKNSLLSAGAIGFLTGMGITKVAVSAAPVVSIILTGNELQHPGAELQYGEVYESNSFALKAALKKTGIETVHTYTAADELDILVKVLREALATSQLVLLTGGVSVGDYDFVVKAAEACGVQQLFHKIKQRPGKPLYFGLKGQQLVFGLPGNPSSVLTCFYEYVLLAMQSSLVKIAAPLAKRFEKPAGLTHFLKGWYDGEQVTALDAQESYRMSSFAVANCLIQVEEQTTLCQAGELAEIHLLPF